MKRIILTSLLTVGVAQVAFAGPAADQKMLNKSMEKIKVSEDYTEKTCGAKIAAKLDDSFKGEEAVATANWCSSAVDALGLLCKDAVFKAAVAKQIKSINCKYDASLKASDNSGVKVQKSGSSVDVAWNKGSSNISDVVKKHLEDTL